MLGTLLLMGLNLLLAQNIKSLNKVVVIKYIAYSLSFLSLLTILSLFNLISANQHLIVKNQTISQGVDKNNQAIDKEAQQIAVLSRFEKWQQQMERNFLTKTNQAPLIILTGDAESLTALTWQQDTMKNQVLSIEGSKHQWYQVTANHTTGTITKSKKVSGPILPNTLN
jgi:hypothetical protein